ncbi:MAG: helix-turn-helix transcriptional regulator [Acidimicrobiia bacterium]|nr:helix-turn-helix transcriptional regulator [Acidimicrobiia bacterium]
MPGKPGLPGRPSRPGRHDKVSPALSPDRIIGDRVAQLRMRHGWTQRAFADRLKTLGVPLHRNSINDLENGHRKVKVGELLALAMALEVSPVELLMPAAATDLIAITDQTLPEIAVKVRLWMLGHGALHPEPVTGAPPSASQREAAERFYQDHGTPELDRRRFVQAVQRATRELTEAGIVDDHDAMAAALDQLERLVQIGRAEIDHERQMRTSYDEVDQRRAVDRITLDDETRFLLGDSTP